MPTHRTARERAREEITEEILTEARRQLAEVGAASLSLRAVARQLGMASSAVYRYVASRDELLTRLIVTAYDSLGEVAEQAAARTAGAPPAERWQATALAIRRWALEHPHEYALVYGSPVPGYAAPEDTVVPGTRASRALIGIVRDAATDGLLDRPGPDDPGAPATPPIDVALQRDLEHLRGELDLPIDDATAVDVLLGWTQLFGLLGFELFGQTRGVVTDHEALFTATARRTAALIGLGG